VTRPEQPRTRQAFDPYRRVVPRPPRVQVAGGLYHITTRANLGRVAFRNDDEQKQFLKILELVVSRRGWSCRAFCLLSTHYHLLAATPAGDISAGMQYLNGRYAQWINAVRGERGHLFDSRYCSVLVQNEGHGIELHRYIALNPVRAGLVLNPEDWPWSSFAALVGLERVPVLLDVDAALADFGPARTARRRLRTFVWDGLKMDAAKEAA
jgi:putative transposase